MWINSIIIWTLIFFMFVGIADKTTGYKKGYGKAFDEGFHAMGPLALVMVGMISSAPVIAEIVRPVITPVFSIMGADPAVFPGMLLAIDMGGYPLALELAGSEEAGLFSGIILSTMLGPTFVFTIPVALGLVGKKEYPFLAKGIMIGLIPVPAGAFIAGVIAGFSPLFLLQQLIPIILFTGIIIAGLLWADKLMIQCFIILGKGIIGFSAVVLGIVAVQELTGSVLISGLTPFKESMEIIGLIVLALAGAFPLVHFLKEKAIPFFKPLIQRSGIGDMAWVGLTASLAHSIPMYKKLHELDNKGKLINVAFSVSGAFVLGGHLGFTAALEPHMVVPMAAGKLSAGIISIIIAVYISDNSVR
ncbi:ethanolamine utilization protein EutH [Salipaludibacillus aurantiacus]|uniref:Ethanolamine transporter n=1 Tax=Salipaludibacillus aurantiacus TaxID=1601833 RepID=A0A1H9RW79_9BACI|nr:ethanolamine utilization protein EutH [Salipaludibacillus aurantiacus]SER76423.1 ethanolamine transporter [Salipaludibacillus aurantiacus]